MQEILGPEGSLQTAANTGFEYFMAEMAAPFA